MFKQTHLWQTTLSAQNDDHDGCRDHLRQALLAMRENAAQLVNLIPIDCKGLTVHDVTHLDALWEMADLICGDRFQLNPCEAFVFGAAVLLHDAGMSVASYPGGLSQLMETIEWRDTAASILKQNAMEPSPDALINLPEDLRREAVFQTLRILHAKHAEDLASAKWPGSSGNEVRLIEDQELRTAFGASIGRIAHSHHWSTDRLVDGTLITSLGAPSFAPHNWTVNEIKIACMLRCADAAHMDRRRAPSLTYALTRPTGVSDLHWKFQNKLNKPTVENDAIIYATGASFDLSEARAWWLCYDTLVMLNGELRTSNSILRDNGSSPFLVRQVAGASDPLTLSRYVRVNGWKPVNAEIRVTNPIHLAKTLGGRNLYGNNFLAPVRELLQNAVDAVRARRIVSKRANDWGSIRLRIEQLGSDTWLHVDDTGIGMSEATLTGALLDFGSSFWRTLSARNEWPGLESSGLEVIGKFGIGFFSAFQLGEHVKVVSRRCDAGKADARLLEFESITLRPIVRLPCDDEVHEDYVTTVSIKITEQQVTTGNPRLGSKPTTKHLSQWLVDQVDQMARLVAGVDVQISLEKASGSYEHAPNWTTSDAKVFLREVAGEATKRLDEAFFEAHAPRVRNLRNESGNIFGRAALSIGGRERSSKDLSGVAVGGFVLSSEDGWYAGLLKGDTTDASRVAARHEVPTDVIANWATEQAGLLSEEHFSLSERLIAAEEINAIGGDPKGLPFCFCGGTIVTRAKLFETALRERRIQVLLNSGYDDRLNWMQIKDLSTYLFSSKLKSNICVFGWSDHRRRVFEDEEVNEMSVQGAPIVLDPSQIRAGSVVAQVFEHLKTLWGRPIHVTLETSQIFAVSYYFEPDAEWVLTVEPMVT
jgi:hypothetical protein